MNTGCLLLNVARLVEGYEGSHTTPPFFHMVASIERSDDGKLVASLQPEDWNFSRSLARRGFQFGVLLSEPVAHGELGAEYVNPGRPD